MASMLFFSITGLVGWVKIIADVPEAFRPNTVGDTLLQVEHAMQ
jgi:hypothetical protein